MFQYAIWSLIWIAWNAFMICLYLEVGILERVSGKMHHVTKAVFLD